MIDVDRQTDSIILVSFRLQVSVLTCYQFFLPFCDQAVDVDVSLTCLAEQERKIALRLPTKYWFAQEVSCLWLAGGISRLRPILLFIACS